jgi:serine/threonine protein kinase/Flp pilus assembly protein TadD
MTSLVGKRFARYDVVEKIGEGGIGVVYRARDLHLGRDVALKLLARHAVVDDPARVRFLREAQVLSRLNHPNITAIYDFNRYRRADYIVMEFVPGVTLSDRLKDGALPEPEILRVALQIAEGLAAAHREGVIHRDLKPGNVRLTPDGRVKILDFGLAEVVQHGDGTDDSTRTEDPALTRSAFIVGTAPYISPEMIAGDPIDPRADIYGLGCVLYEMGTGQRPFLERDTARLFYSIRYEKPEPPTKLNEHLSAGFEEVVLRALEKDPERRFPTAEEVAEALKRAQAASAAAVHDRPRQIDSIVVLPLEDLSGDVPENYFADGLHEALISSLAKLGGLRVISRTSAMQYKRTAKPLPQIASELRVDAALEGTCQRQGDRVRVNAQLIQAATDKHLWAESYDGRMDDFLTLQSDIARSVAHEIALKLLPREEAALMQTETIDAEAQDFYLQGRFYWNRRDLESLPRAIVYFKLATEKAPNYALAYAGLADAYNILANWSVVKPEDGYPLAKEAARKALEIDGTLGEAHVALAFAEYIHDWNWVEAEQVFKRAIRLNPSYASGHSWYAVFLATRKRHYEAIAEARRSQEVDPLSPIITATAAWVHYEAREYGDAIRRCRAFLEANPGFPMVYLILGLACTQERMYDEGITAFERGLSLAGGLTELYAGLGFALGASGRAADAKHVLEDLARVAESRYVPPYSRAVIEIGLGERERTLELLEESCAHRNTWLILLGVEPMFDSLRSDPRFQGLLRRIGLPA